MLHSIHWQMLDVNKAICRQNTETRFDPSALDSSVVLNSIVADVSHVGFVVTHGYK